MTPAESKPAKPEEKAGVIAQESDNPKAKAEVAAQESDNPKAKGESEAGAKAEAKDGKLADYEPPAVTDANAMEVIANGNRRIQGADGGAVIDLSKMGDSDSTALCALLEWIAEGKKKGAPVAFRNIQPRQTKMLTLYQLSDLITPYCQKGK